MRLIPHSEALYVLVGRSLARKRSEAKLTQTQLASLCGLTRGSIANIESGNQRPTLHTLLSLADSLDVEMRSFFPTSDEIRMHEANSAGSDVAGWVRDAADGNKSPVAYFIASSREKV